MDDMNPAVERGDADAGGEPEEAANEQQRPLGGRPVPELLPRPLPLRLRRRGRRLLGEAIELLLLPARRSAGMDAAVEVAQEAAHAPGAPRGGGPVGRLDVDVAVAGGRARRGARQRRRRGGARPSGDGGRVGSEERGVVVVAGGGHGGWRQGGRRMEIRGPGRGGMRAGAAKRRG